MDELGFIDVLQAKGDPLDISVKQAQAIAKIILSFAFLFQGRFSGFFIKNSQNYFCGNHDADLQSGAFDEYLCGGGAEDAAKTLYFLI